MKLNQTILLIVCIFLSGVSIYLLSPLIISQSKSKSHNKKKQTTDYNNNNNSEVTIQGFCFRQANKNQSEIWVLNSKEGKIYKKTNKIECKDISCNLIRNEENVACINAKKSLLYRNENKVFLYDTVKCSYPNLVLESQESIIYLKENKIEMFNGVKSEISPICKLG